MNWDNFSCVDIMRVIRNEIDAKLACMTDDEISDYLENINIKFRKRTYGHRLLFTVSTTLAVGS